ncbi:hypothetical protein Prum_066220 [Phytohabitans rumicis]|uniref:Uncharacterized protein n=1 Tax=Phytohabitans rumicis TaxID=1076125 RepID=A0A6V8LBH9_9ACTN|nr:hypothetical protein [Phytohabitans rumicis]GFJ92980.1 hypothetical protein Prum_066220 [Phytohabitans rumicis]
MLEDLADHGGVLGAYDAVGPRGAGKALAGDRGQAGRHEPLDDRVAAERVAEDEAVDPGRVPGGGPALPGRDQRDVVVVVGGPFHHTEHKGHVVGGAGQDGRYVQPDRAGAGAAQVAGRPVRHVAERLGHLDHLGARTLRHPPGAGEGVRRGGLRHARPLGDGE